MTQELKPLQWPNEGDDVREIDPFTLAEGDRIYIGKRPFPRGGHKPIVPECFRLGPKSGNERKRTATRTAFDGSTLDVLIYDHSDVVTIEELGEGTSRIYWYSEPGKCISRGNDISVLCGGFCLSSSEYVAAIRIIPAKHPTTPEPATCSAKP